MLLVIDCGNTNTKFGLREDACAKPEFLRVFRIDTDVSLSGADYRARFDTECRLAGIDPAGVTDAAIATVVPAARAALVEFALGLTGREPLVIGASGVDLGLRVLIDRPAEAGADRLVAAVAAHAGWPGAKIVLDFGTATTFDVVTAAGDYAGGVIAPGVNLALDALHAGTAQLPRIKVARPAAVVGKGTVAAMESGIYWGYIGLIEGIVARIRAEFGNGPFTVIATGGLAALFKEGTSVIDATDPELTLRGIAIVHALNRGRSGPVR